MGPEPLPIRSPVPLEASHDLSAFDCGSPDLNEYLKTHALDDQQNQSARTYVARRGDGVVGYYTLGRVGEARGNARAGRQGLARHPVPVLLLARLAVDDSEQGRGIGKGLLK